jgi:hypothetical protein
MISLRASEMGRSTVLRPFFLAPFIVPNIFVPATRYWLV